MRGETCSGNKFLWLLHIFLSLSLLSSLCPLTLSRRRMPGGMHICAAHFCLFSCLWANICTPSGDNKVDLYMSSCPIYFMQHDMTSFPQSPQALPITYLQCALSSEYPLMADWTVTLQQRRVYKRFFCLSVFLELTSSLHRHHLLSLWMAQRQTVTLKWAFSPLRTLPLRMWVNGEQLFLSSAPFNNSFPK